MKKFRKMSYNRFSRIIAPVAVLWHQRKWADNVISFYYGKYEWKKGQQKSTYYLRIDTAVYVLQTVDDLIDLDYDLYIQRTLKGNAAASSTQAVKPIDYCSICPHRNDCPLQSFVQAARKDSCLFIPLFHFPVSKLELLYLRQAIPKLIADMVLMNVQSDRKAQQDSYEKCSPVFVYMHTFRFAQLQ